MRTDSSDRVLRQEAEPACDNPAQAPKERPILFSSAMVRALLDGSKTQTRRPVKGVALEWLRPEGFTPEFVADPANHLCPYGVPGESEASGPCAGCGAVVDSRHRVGGSRLWVRETWAAPHAYDHLPPRLIPQDARIHYAATEQRGGLLWRPSIHMPRWASRITLEVTGVRVERLQAISEADARAEGCPCYVCGRPMDGRSEDDCHCFHRHAGVDDYRQLWEQINGPGSWDANPWVWVLSFRKATSGCSHTALSDDQGGA